MDFLEHELEEILNIFREESEEQLQKLNKNLLALESNPKDYTAISELFREAHSLKGASRMIGLNDIQSIAHKLEDVFGMAKEGYLEVTSEIVDVMCRAVDCISSIISESIRTMGKAQVPEIQEVLDSLDKVIKQEAPGDLARESSNEYSDEVNAEEIQNQIEKEVKKSIEKPVPQNYANEEINTILTYINVNIEKLKVFSTSTDALEEFLYFVNKLYNSLDSIDNNRLKGLIEDVKIKIETALRGSGILVDDEVHEIEDTFDNFIKLYERISFMEKPDSINVPKVNIKTELPEPVPEKPIEENSPAEDKTLETQEEPAVIENIPEETPVNISQEADKETEIKEEPVGKNIENPGSKNYEDINRIRENINIFSNHTEENTGKFEEILLKINAITATINDDKVRQVLEKISDFLAFSKEKEAPINPDMVKVLKESFDEAVKMLNPSPDEINEDPSLIIQRISVLKQMLKMAVSREVSKSENKTGENNETLSNTPAETKLSPIKRNTEMYSKNRNNNETTNKPPDLKFGESNTIKTLRVDTQKLDQLVNQTGELIIAKIKAKEHLLDIEKMIRYIEEWHRKWTKTRQYFRYSNKYPLKSPDSKLSSLQFSPNKNINAFLEENSSKISSLMNKMNALYKVIQEDDARLNLIVSGLEEKIKSVRVLPLATIFHLFPRMVRDIARDRDKEVEFFITGSETSVDKKIIEEIKSPLMHIIRNSIDHGIEPPEERAAAGKPPTGKMLLAAYHLENSVLIEVTDDGKGIDVNAIKKKVLQKELLTKEELDTMSEEQVMNIIFWPGFSTGETVTDISGRGIGLDIVHTKITQLNGNIRVKSSLGKGCQVSIQIPVTMATINSFLVEINSQTFAIPTNSIKTTLLVDESQVFYKEGERTILVDDKTVPICPLSEVLELPDSQKKSDKLVIIVVQAEDAQVGFIVDKLVGDHEILHKNLSAPLLKVRNVAGITTLGSGDLCLILNVNDLIKSTYMRSGKFGNKQAALTAAAAEVNSRKRKVLVIDDSATTRILQRNILKTSGYEVDVAVNGFDALGKTASTQYDFIITDAEMPEMDGFELTERLRNDEKYQNIPIIIVTSLTSEEDRQKGVNVGANAYITKGKFNQEELLNTMTRLES